MQAPAAESNFLTFRHSPHIIVALAHLQMAPRKMPAKNKTLFFDTAQSI